jgi:hypothetical protein
LPNASCLLTCQAALERQEPMQSLSWGSSHRLKPRVYLKTTETCSP